MYPSSSSSASQQSVGPTSGGGGLARYGSAPSSFLEAAVESVAGGGPRSAMVGHYFTGDSACKTVSDENRNEAEPGSGSGLQRSYGFNNAGSSTASYLKLGEPSASASSLVRQQSSPAGFLSHLSSDSSGGFSVTRGPGVFRLKPQSSKNVLDGVRIENGHQKASHCYADASFGIDSWENSASIAFSSPSSKRAKNVDGDFLNYTSLESQFSLPQTSLEMATVEKLMQIPEDSIACKIRAKRGCATHPRSIAERERRIRISGKLKKLQDLVPNMDKQTSYADMLDLAVQHIKGLQNQVQNLHKDLESCTCGCRPSAE